jgi:hypothetical protein
MRPSRRDFLRTAGALAGGLSVGRSLGASTDFSGQERAEGVIREDLLKRRQRIDSLQLDYSYQSSNASDLLNGRNHLFLSKGRYHLRHDDPQSSIVQILNGERGLDAVIGAGGVVLHVRHWNRSERRSNPHPLDNFLPQLEDKPVVSRGQRQIDGDPCRGLLQGDRLFWVSTRKNLVRSVEFYRTATTVGERIRFADFMEPAANVLFPRSVTIVDFDDQGEPFQTKVISVESVAINEPLSEDLFEVERFPRKGERLAF